MSKVKLVGLDGELEVSIDARSWHVLDHDEFFKQGPLLRKAFGANFVAGLFKRPADGVLQRSPAAEFRSLCENVWADLLRDKDLLSYSYSYEFEREQGVKHYASMSGVKVQGLHGSVWTKPRGYCTLHLMDVTPSGRGRTVEVIDLRGSRGIQTDDRGFMKVHRRSMKIDWYQEMPRILDFCARNVIGNIEVRLP